jgi:hypothetical protein
VHIGGALPPASMHAKPVEQVPLATLPQQRWLAPPHGAHVMPASPPPPVHTPPL